MTNELLPLRIEYVPTFLKALKNLGKKYRHIQADVQAFLDSIKTDHFPGERITELGYVVYKAQIKNTDTGKGKSGSYRIVYHYGEPDLILFIVIYSKSDQTDINKRQIAYLIRDYYESIAAQGD